MYYWKAKSGNKIKGLIRQLNVLTDHIKSPQTRHCCTENRSKEEIRLVISYDADVSLLNGDLRI